MTGLDWGDVPWAETKSETTWAVMRLVGTFHGDHFAVAEPPSPVEGQTSQIPSPDFTTSCPEPAGGWVVTATDRASEADFENARAYAESQPGYAGLWIDWLIDLTSRDTDDFDASLHVVNVVFTGDVDDHDARLRDLYGGPLCVTKRSRSLSDLEEIQQGLHELLVTEEAQGAGIYATHGAVFRIDVVRGVIIAEVFAVTNGSAQDWIDTRFGRRVVELHSKLTPTASTGPDTTAQAICELLANEYGPEYIVTGAFTTTVAQIRSMTGGYPQRWPDLSGDHSATVCYLDGPIAKSPPPGPNGEVQPSFDRAVIAIADEAHAELIIAGYQETLAVTQP